MNPQQAWQSVLEQLQLEMPRASFDTWVQDTQAVSLEDDILLVSARNAYSRDWLESRLTSTTSRMLIGILNAAVEVRFVVQDVVDEMSDDDPEEDGKGFTAEPENKTQYDAEVYPTHIVMLEAYCLRLLEQGDMTAKEMSLWVGFHQAIWRQWHQGKGTVHNVPHWDVMSFAMMGRASYFRELAKAELVGGRKFLAGGHVEIVPEASAAPTADRRWDNANRYRVSMSPRLTRRDCAVIETILTAEVSMTATRAEALQVVTATLQNLAERDVMDWINQEVLPAQSWPRSVQEIVRRVLDVQGDLSEELITASEKVYSRIVGAFGKLQITHYFLRVVAPTMQFSHAQAWAIIALRDRCWFDHATQTQKNFALLRGGIKILAKWVNVTDKSVSNWMAQPEFSAFIRFVDMDAIQDAPEDWKQSGTQIVFVHLDEPLLGELFDGKPWKNRDSILEKVRLYSGKSETQFWKKRDSILEKVRLDLGKSETRLNNLIKPQLNLFKPQGTPTSGSPSARAAVMPSVWVLDRLLSVNRVHPKTRKSVRGGDAKALVSWLLYAMSPEGSGIKNPVSYALTRLGEDPTSGAGGAFDDLAALSPSDLITVIQDGVRGMSQRDFASVEQGSTAGHLWLSAMGSGNTRATALLSILLGEDAPLIVEKIRTQTTVQYV